jgi:hypothetical protein
VITRHKVDPLETLQTLRVAEAFDEIIHIVDPSIPKADRMDGSRGAVLVDDSFNERYACSKKQGILAVDATAVPGITGLVNARR